MLKRFYAKKDEVPEALSAYYVEQDGGFVLQAEGHVDRAKVDEMRTENIALRKKLDELTAKFDGVDPVEVRRLAEEKRQLEEAAQLKAGQFEKVLTTRLTAMKSEFDKQLAAVTTERDTAQKQLVTIQIDRGVLEAATIGNAQAECGGAQAEPTAMSDGADTPSAAANSSRAVAVVVAVQSRINFAALMVGGCHFGGGGAYRRGASAMRCIQPPDLAGWSDWMRMHSAQPSAKTRHQSGRLHTGQGCDLETRVKLMRSGFRCAAHGGGSAPGGLRA